MLKLWRRVHLTQPAGNCFTENLPHPHAEHYARADSLRTPVKLRHRAGIVFQCRCLPAGKHVLAL